jgi:hypothetical protein
MPVILAIRRQQSGGLQFKASLGKLLQRPYLDPTHKKRAGGVTQVLELLPSKHETLSSTIPPPKKRELPQDLIFLLIFLVGLRLELMVSRLCCTT